VCRKNIYIGSGTEFGTNVLIYDHDHDYRAGLKTDKFKESPVKIGNNCWIGANSVILRGTVLGNNCVIAAGSVIRGEYPDNSVIIQKRVTDIRGGRLIYSKIIILKEMKNCA
jgi:acetyltransferase-like isoleucine patch superfamily enzyme